jgi:hypothetical protein
MKFIKKAAMVACATATAVMAFAAPASAVTLQFIANGPADWSRGCDMTTKGWGTYNYYESGGQPGGYQAFAGGFDAGERDTCSDGYGAVLHLTYQKWTGTQWIPASANPIKVTTGVNDYLSRSWTFKDVRDVRVFTCRIDDAGALSACTAATFY